jgi:hypothetical protein
VNPFAHAELVCNLLVDHRGMKRHISLDQKILVASVDVVTHLAQGLGIAFVHNVDDGVLLIV